MRKSNSISMKLIAVMLVITVIGMGTLAAISAVMSSSALKEQSMAKINQTTAREALAIDSWLNRQTTYFSAMAADLSRVDDYSYANLQPLLQLHVDGNPQYFDVYLGKPDGKGEFATGWIPEADSGWISYERGWYKGAASDPSVPFVTAPYTDAQTQKLCITVSKAILKGGSVAGVAAADMFIDVLQEMVGKVSVGEDSHAFLVDADGGILVYPGGAYGPDEEDNFQSIQKIEGGTYADMWQLTQEDGVSAKIISADGVERYYTAQSIPTTGWKLYSAIPAKVVMAPVYKLLMVMIPVFIGALFASGILIYLMIRRIVLKPISDITEAARTLSKGSMDICLEGQYQGEIGELATSFLEMSSGIREQVDATRRMADGDLTARISPRSEFDVMGNALRDLSESLNRMIAGIAGASKNVTSGSSQIADNSQNLAQGATEQASSVEQLSASMNDIVEKIRVNEERTNKASEVSQKILEDARLGTRQMDLMVGAVEEISDASASISRVIKAIEDIAFQTNILALNAAVEAARAGQHGNGFAVVEDEVRTLASRSAQAASETTTLIENSINKSEEGAKIANQTSESLRAIIESIGSTASLMSEISQAGSEQARAIAQVNQGVDQVNRVVSANAAISEECAAAAEELSFEANSLANIVKEFTVR